MRRSSIVPCALVLWALTACQQPQSGANVSQAGASAADDAAIKQVLQREIAAARANSADSFAAIIAPDAMVKPPNEALVSGPGLQAWLKNMFATVTINEITYTDEKIWTSGNLAIHSYGFDWTVTPKGGKPIKETGHGIHVLQRQPDGSWKMQYDTWSSDTAVPAPTPAPRTRN